MTNFNYMKKLSTTKMQKVSNFGINKFISLPHIDFEMKSFMQRELYVFQFITFKTVFCTKFFKYIDINI